MNRWRFVILIPALVLATLVMPSSASAVETRRLSFKGPIVGANFYTPEDECVFTSVSIQVAEGIFDDESGPAQAYRKAFVSLLRMDGCHQTTLLHAHGLVPFDDQAFEADNQLHSARLNTTARICGFEPGSCFDLSINLKWTGIGGTTSRESQSRSVSPTCTNQTYSNELDRSAIVSGSISSDVFSLNPAMSNFASLDVARNRWTIAKGEDCSDAGGGAFPM